MSEVGGKKFIVITPEEYELLVKNSKREISSTLSTFNNGKLLEPPEKVALHQSNEKIQSVWDRQDVGEDEKVRIFMKEFKKFKTYYDQLSKPKIVEIRNSVPSSSLSASMGAVRQNDSNQGDQILKDLGKVHRGNAEKLMKHIEEYGGDSVRWDKKSGELVYNDIRLQTSNISKLLKDVVSAGKRQSSEPQHLSTFLKALSEIETPLSMVKNPKSLSLMRAYAEKGEEENKSNVMNEVTPSPRKKMKTTGTPLKPNNRNMMIPSLESPPVKKSWISSTRAQRVKR